MSELFSADAWNKIWIFRGVFLQGLGNTALTALFGLLLALVIGILSGLFATGGSRLLRAVSRVYVELIQNTPLLLQMCFLYYSLAFAGMSPGIIKTVIIAVGVYHGA